ncbi:MAG: deoxyribonuclease IV [Candidatus Kerfeldbacteria bacterium]|nr:deoxyribonuclease IV [Candidatus Kerfeldbacteria bacterium]
MQKIGAHVSAAGGVSNAPLNAQKEACEVFQFFLNPPQTYKFTPISEEQIAAFKKNCKELGYTETYVHASYLINLCSPKNSTRYGSMSLLRKGLEEASKLGIQGMMFHTGSATGCPDKPTAIKTAIESINKILDGYTGSTKLLIENAAGSGNTVGVSFAEVGTLLKGIKNKKQVGVCLDTQHSFASGYDWRTPIGTNAALKEFDKEIGLKNLTVIQANDSKVDCGANKDRHEHIHLGKMGTTAFKNLLHHPKLANTAFVLETEPEGRAQDMAWLKKFRNKK